MEQKNKETYWSRFTEDFEKKQSHVVGQEILLLAHQELLKENNLGDVLELGCGTGLYTETLQKISKNVVATDFSEEMIVYAQQKRGNLENVRFQQADALNLDFEAESFDTVFMANLIHVIGNAEKVIQESKRVLKKGGKLIINSFAIADMSFLNQLTMGIRYIKTFGKPSAEATKEKTTKESVETLLISNGFEISKSILLGRKYKSFYITATKI
ncbi:methyltransferase domain-containing protein [Prolixibacteraceae bacterium Z1-6]|uniref:Methyltransferase domain-containing protein n=1 Tax=Draconibacterium aestuarii TaxID=2998507 RepID=A0A9X3FAL1_9BACT|nr:methyltransferase domain-containing protein [Prolixibacteraceae bacterium Z1-6]